MSPPLVVPFDFSPSAAAALAFGRRLAAATDAPLHAIHVRTRPDAGPFDAPHQSPTAADEDSETARAVAALAEAAGTGAVVAVVRGAAAAPEIARYAAQVEAGVVVVGACGQRGARPGLGGVAGEVVETAPADVVVVPFHAEAPRGDGPPRRVLVAVDLEGGSAPLVALGVGLADRLGADGADVVHVVEPLPHPVRWLDETIVDLAPQILERAHAALRTLTEGTDAALYVERGKAAPTIVRVAAALESGLIVVGPHGDRLVLDGLLGTVAEGVARRARCPVYVARRSAFPHPDPVHAWSYRPASPA